MAEQDSKTQTSGAADGQAGGQAGGQTGGQKSGASAQGGSGDKRGFVIHTQYIKDLSFENPNAPQIYMDMKEAPAVSVNLDVRAARLRERSFEVTIKAEVKATLKEKPAFVIELAYAGLVTIQESVPDDQFHSVLLIDVPRHLFPFARAVISGATRDGGFPPLLINPVDFERLYEEQKARVESEGQKQPEQTPQSTA